MPEHRPVVRHETTEWTIGRSLLVGGGSSATFIDASSVNWNTVLGPLAPGDYEVCARATGSDGGGTGNVVECSTFHVNAPPVCTALETSLETLWPPNHKLRLVTVTGASDPEVTTSSPQLRG